MPGYQAIAVLRQLRDDLFEEIMDYEDDYMDAIEPLIELVERMAEEEPQSAKVIQAFAE